MDSRIPTESECFELLAELGVDSAIVQHSVAVKNAALEFASQAEKKGHTVNMPLLSAAALLHDIMKRDAEVCHCVEGAALLRKRGFSAVAAVMEKHGLNNLRSAEFVPKTAEEKLLMYSDLRVLRAELVSLDDRFAYVKERYKVDDSGIAFCKEFAKSLEKELGVR